MNQAQQPPLLVNSILFCYDAEKHKRNDNESKQHFLQHKGKRSNNKDAYTYGSKRTGRKVDFPSSQISLEERHYQKQLPSTQLK